LGQLLVVRHTVIYYRLRAPELIPDPLGSETSFKHNGSGISETLESQDS